MANYSQPLICQCLTRLPTRRSTSVVTITGNRRKNGSQFVADVLSLAHGLLQLGLGNGDIVAISGFNSDLYLEWLLGVAFVGGIVAPLNYRWSFEEAKSAMLMVRPVVLVTDESCKHWYSELQHNCIPSVKWHVYLSSSSSGFIKASNVLTTETLRRHTLRSSPLSYSWVPDAAVLYALPQVYLHTAPSCHIGGLSSGITMLMVGGCHVLIPKFEAALATDAIEQHCVAALIIVPAIMADLISSMRLNGTWKGRHHVKKILNGGGSLSVELMRDAAELFPSAKLLSAYETCSSLTFTTIYDPALRTHSQILQTVGTRKSSPDHQPQGVCVGKPAPHVELKICSDGHSNVGRILTRGPHLMLRYWDQNQTKAAVRADEFWLDTGDFGSIDDCSNVWLGGRRNVRIKSGGENVHPEEVEAILLRHPGVIAAAVVGIPDARLTEMVVACTKLRVGNGPAIF